jgi:predicted nucleotidyltransferase
MMNPDKSFYLRELSRDLKIPYSMLYKEEKNLVSLDIVNEEKKGKVTLVSVNRKLPYFTELKDLIIKTVGLSEPIRNALLGLKEVQYALIYGSFASGEETESSDIDLLIIGDAEEENILRSLSKIEDKIGRDINYILWDRKELEKRISSRHHLLLDIIAKPVIMLVGDEDEFRRAVKK